MESHSELRLVIRLNVRNCIQLLSFSGMWIAIVAAFVLSSADKRTCLRTCSWLVVCLLFLTGCYPKCSSFRHFSNFGAVSLLRSERARPSPLPLSLGSCLNANESPHATLAGLLSQSCFLGMCCASSFRFSFARSSHCKSVLVSICLDMRILDFSVRYGFGP